MPFLLKLSIFLLAPERFQCTPKGTIMSKDLKLGKISTRESTLNFFIFPKMLQQKLTE